MLQALLRSAVLVFLLPALAQAQPQARPKFLAKIEQVRAGFRAYNINDGSGQFKVGAWTPVYVDVTAGPAAMPNANAAGQPFLQFESSDSEGVGTFYRVPISLEANESRTFIGYTRPGNYDTATRLRVTLDWNGKTFPSPEQIGSPVSDLAAHLYLSIGSRIPDLREALLSLAKEMNPNAPVADPNSRDTGPRYAVFETAVQQLPELWFAYQGVDLLFLNTDKKDFLTELMRDANRPRLQAIAQWVRRGGRLVIPVNHLTQDLLAPLLQAPVWQPPVPVVPPALPGDVKQAALKRLASLERWANTTRPFPGPGENAIPIARLDPGRLTPGAWEVSEKTEDGRPLIATIPYGRGNITYLAFSLDQSPFTRWEGRTDFLKTLLGKFAPRVGVNDKQQFAGGGFRGGGAQNDVATSLQQTLDNFDVNIVPFGFVALFIVLYILVVGPLDYFILKHVFHKLELTWITFPVVVVSVSVAAYFSAYALKGNDLKINKIDIVDFDLRTELDARERPARAFAYGQSYFTILSPRIQNYTVGVEPNPAFWAAKIDNPLSADQVTWLGRPEFDGPGAMGRSGSQSFFRRPYAYAEEARGLEGVPIPVWTTKSFSASWEAALPKLPFEADLVYQTRPQTTVTGSFKNNLGVDLEDVWIVFGGRAYPTNGVLPGAVKSGASLAVTLDKGQRDISAWVNNSQEFQAQLAPRNVGFHSVQGIYDPTLLVRQAMFSEEADRGNTSRNQSMRFLDLSWRLQPPVQQAETRVREAILYAHVPFQRGLAGTLTMGPSPLPTNLWLGELPRPGAVQPAHVGTMAQDTFIRVLIPVRLSSNP